MYRLRNRTTKKSLKKKVKELEKEVNELTYEVFPHKQNGWIISFGVSEEKKALTRLEKLEEKINLLAKHTGLEFVQVKENFKLEEPKEEK
jgi:nicotinic acid phosphoribosyltransferase